MLFRAALTLSALALAEASCSANKFSPITAPLAQEATSVSFSGTFSLLNGCRFQISGFQFSGGPGDCSWFGSDSTGSSSLGTRVVDGNVGPSSGDKTFDLSESLGSFKVLKLFCASEKLVIGNIAIDGAGSGSGSGSNSPTSPPPSANDKNVKDPFFNGSAASPLSLPLALLAVTLSAFFLAAL